MNYYTTKQGDTFDAIALRYLGNEYLFIDLIRLNYKYRDVIVFDEGIKLAIPDNIEIDNDSDIPEWLIELDKDPDIDIVEAAGEDDGESW